MYNPEYDDPPPFSKAQLHADRLERRRQRRALKKEHSWQAMLRRNRLLAWLEENGFGDVRNGADDRFDLVLYPRTRCAGETERWVAFKKELGMSFMSRFNCRRKVVICQDGRWWCAKCIQSREVPLHAEHPELHMRPLNDLGHPRFSGMRGAPFHPWGVARAMEYLHLSLEEMWHAIIVRHSLPIVGGGTRRPYLFHPADVEHLQRTLVRDAAARLQGVWGTGQEPDWVDAGGAIE